MMQLPPAERIKDVTNVPPMGLSVRYKLLLGDGSQSGSGPASVFPVQCGITSVHYLVKWLFLRSNSRTSNSMNPSLTTLKGVCRCSPWH